MTEAEMKAHFKKVAETFNPFKDDPILDGPTANLHLQHLADALADAADSYLIAVNCHLEDTEDYVARLNWADATYSKFPLDDPSPEVEESEVNYELAKTEMYLHHNEMQRSIVGLNLALHKLEIVKEKLSVSRWKGELGELEGFLPVSLS